MTFDDMLALDTDALNLALEEHVFHHHWEPWEVADGRLGWRLRHADGRTTFSSVPHLHVTASWDAIMPLANAAHLMRSYVPSFRSDAQGAWCWVYHGWRLDGGDAPVLRLPGEAPDAAHREALCRLVLWYHTQEGEEVS